jgi:glycine/D-amino acid oxidase-like deaminating enzyme
MRIAVIGAGLAGLSVSLFLHRLGGIITLFDGEGLGGGASGVAAGLVHPYPGEKARLSLWGEESMHETAGLLEELAPYAIREKGIVRATQNEEQRFALSNYPNVDHLGEGRFFLRSALVIDTGSYLKALFIASSAKLVRSEIIDLESMGEFDRIVIAVGHRAAALLPEFADRLGQNKGQIFDVACDEKLSSTVSKGYLLQGEKHYRWGATYERGYSSESPDPDRGYELLSKNFFPFTAPPRILACKSGIRLNRRGHYLPVAMKVRGKIWWFGALGSRGLLYHAYLGRKVAEAIVANNSSLLPVECLCR